MTGIAVTATLSRAGLTVTFRPLPAPAQADAGNSDGHPADESPSVKAGTE